jgi:hypothetical protein
MINATWKTFGIIRISVMFKVISLLKRKVGMPIEEFIAYYETMHSKLGGKYLQSDATKYIRRYFRAMPHPLTKEVVEPEYDGMMELWFEDREHWEAALARFAAPDVAEIIVQDEKQFLDRDRIRMFVVEDERETCLPV